MTDYTVPTGEFISEWLEENDMSQAELARRMGLSAKHVSKLIHGSPLSADVAAKLELVTGVAARIWLGYEATYRADVARLSLEDQLVNAKELASSFPLAPLRKLGIVSATLARPGKVALELFAFFRVSSVEALESVVNRGAVAFRQSASHTVDEYALATWLRLVELDAESVDDDLPPYDEKRLREQVAALRQHTRDLGASFGSDLVNTLGAAGVKLHFVPDVKGARVYGATRWVKDRPCIVLTTRGKNDGQFWFTLFHEIGHVLLHRDGKTHISAVDGPGEVSVTENEANDYATITLIPTEFDERLRGVSRKAEVVSLADELGISTGIVVGQLWRRGIWPYQHGHDLTKSITLVPGHD